MRKKLKFKLKQPKSKFRAFFFWFVNTKSFDVTITTCIFLNTVAMSMKFYGMSSAYAETLDVSNLVFTVIFNFEFLFKILGLGRTYFSAAWNNFDMSIVVMTDLGLMMKVINLGFDISTAATVVRAFRIMRIFRLIRSSRGMRIILDTLVHILPQITNVMSLIFLLFFIYSALGINLFSGVKF